MITNSLYVASVMKLVIQESTVLRLNAVFASKMAVCRTYVIATISKKTISKNLMKFLRKMCLRHLLRSVLRLIQKRVRSPWIYRLEMLIRKCQWIFKRIIKVRNAHAQLNRTRIAKYQSVALNTIPYQMLRLPGKETKALLKNNRRLPNSVYNAVFSLLVFRCDGNFCKLKCTGP